MKTIKTFEAFQAKINESANLKYDEIMNMLQGMDTESLISLGDDLIGLGDDEVQDEDYDDDDFGFESPFCKPCEGTGCEECDGSGMKRNSVVNNDYKDRSMYNPYYGENAGESEEWHETKNDLSRDEILDWISNKYERFGITEAELLDVIDTY